METETRVDDLVDRWEDMRDHGMPLSIEELCASCPELVGEVRHRVEALQAMDSALDTEKLESRSMAGHCDPTRAGPDHRVPEVLRATAVYRPRRHHDHGGLGVVYTAHQEELDRLVALKRIRPDKLRASARRRFLREAALTARLQHPGIVPIYGLGQDDGGPFYTMPFIRGQNLQGAIDTFHSDDSLRRDPGRRSLGFRGLLQQFIAACNTVAYAHDQGVVHRDLKPSNIMLGPYGETLVMDWGLAKRFGDGAANDDAGDAPSPGPSSEDVTVTGEILGTPHYMSPEQAKGETVGPASDVFSLGLILYAILTGKSAFETSGLRAPDRLEAGREAAIVPPRSRDPRLSRALEAICLKALASRAEDRYLSARSLADDVTRWLADEPVTAWREPVSIRVRRWGWRHRTAATAAVVALVAGVIGLGVVAAVQAQANDRLKRSHDETLEALAQSEESRKQAEAVSTFLVETFRRPDPSQDGRELKVVDVLDRASDQLDQAFAGSKATQGALLDALGRTYLGLGLNDRAESRLTRARDVREAALGPDHPDTLSSCARLANTYDEQGRLSDAIALHEATLQRRQITLGPDHPDTLASRNDLAGSYLSAGRLSQAIELLEEVCRLSKIKLGPDHPKTLKSLGNLASSYRAAGRLSDAITLQQEALRLKEAKLGSDHVDTIMNRMNLGIAYRAAGRFSEAIAQHQAALKGYSVKLGPDHPLTLRCMIALASDYGDDGQFFEALGLFETALERAKTKLDSDHPLTLMCRNNLAAIYQGIGRTTDAIGLHASTLELYKAKLGLDHDDTFMSLVNLAIAYQEAGRLSEAIKLYEETLNRLETQRRPDHPFTLENRKGLAAAYESLGRWAEAESLLRESLARLQKAAKTDSPTLAGVLVALGRNLLEQSRMSEAEPLLQEAVTILEKVNPDDWSRYNAMSLLGGALLGQGRSGEAESPVVAGYEGMKAREARIGVPDRFRLREAAERVVRLYEEWGKPEKATEWKAKLGMPDLPADVFAGP